MSHIDLDYSSDLDKRRYLRNYVFTFLYCAISYKIILAFYYDFIDDKDRIYNSG